MKLEHILAALATALALAVLPGFADARAESWGRTFPRACTPEVQKCLEKLEARLNFHGRIYDWLEMENALRELHDTDPECALLLRGAGMHDL